MTIFQQSCANNVSALPPSISHRTTYQRTVYAKAEVPLKHGNITVIDLQTYFSVSTNADPRSHPSSHQSGLLTQSGLS